MIDTCFYTNYPDGFVLSCDDRPYKPNKPSIKHILFCNYDWLEKLNELNLLRRAIMDNIDRTLLCKTFYLGYDAFECPTCHNENLLFRHCHSRFCNSCGVKQQKLISSKVAEMAVDAPHRHIVFTIPEEIRDFFRIDRDAMNLLFIAARNTICLIFNDKIYKKAKKKNFPNSYYLYRHFRHQKDFGMIACLHTFGRDLKWNPHIHALVPEITYDPEAHTVKPFTHLNFEKLRRTFQYELLRLMTEHFEKRFNIFKKFKKYNKFKRFKEIKDELYNNHFKGFYVYAKYTKYDTSETKGKKINNVKGVKAKVDYIMRYASRPAMAESRLISFNRETNTVVWFYDRHEDNKRIEVTEDAHEFIKKLIIHIPDNHFQMIRYYGFYNNKKRESLDDIYLILAQKKEKKYISVKQRARLVKLKSRKYRTRTFILDSYNRDILKCPCGTIMKYVDTYDPLKGKTNDERYRKDCINEMREMWKRRRSPRMGT